MMATYKSVVILFMVGLCWGGALYPETEAIEALDNTQRREGSSVVEKQSCPTWYREIKRNGVSRCVCGALKNVVVCDDPDQEALLTAAGFLYELQ